MKVLVTGGTGFIGSHLCKRLSRMHHSVTVLVRNEKKRRLLPPKADVLSGDMSIFKDPHLELPEFEIVIHLAGQIYADSPEEYVAGNYETLVDLVQCIQRQSWRPKRFLYASSLAAAGPSGDSVLTEADDCHPVEDYGRAKLMGEEFLSGLTDFPTTSFRPAIVFGPGDENTLILFRMARFRIGMTIDGQPQLLSFVDVDDLNEAIIRMMEEDSEKHQVYFVAHPEIITNKDIFRTLGKVMGHRVFILPIPGRGLQLAKQLAENLTERFGWKNQLDEKQYHQLLNNFACSGHKLESELGWQPKRDLFRSLRVAYDSYRSAGKL